MTRPPRSQPDPDPGTDPAAAPGSARGSVPVVEIDAIGLICPLPVLRARKRLAELSEGAVLAILADDPMAAIDLPHFCAEAGHALLSATPAPGGGRRFVIRKGR